MSIGQGSKRVPVTYNVAMLQGHARKRDSKQQTREEFAQINTSHVALQPSGAMRSQVDQGERHGYPKNEITKLTTVQHLNVQRCSFTHYSPVVTPRTPPSTGRSTKRDTNHNIPNAVCSFAKWSTMGLAADFMNS